MLAGKRILLGVTGGIAAYKSAYLLRLLQKAGASVRVAMTPSATRFVGADTFAALSGSEVAVQIFSDAEQASDSWTRHIDWAEWADLMVVAPCTANTLAKIVHGLSDNMVSALALAARCPLLLCPTMDGGMYRAPATQNNLSQARRMGMHLMEPGEGYLASGLEDRGRLPEPEAIRDRIAALLDQSRPETQSLLKGQKVVVTAGPTREYLDAVRYLSNPSSGKMGFAMAEAARNRGAEVVLVHGPVNLDPPDGIETIAVESAEEMFEAVKKQQGDIYILAAAVSDFAPDKRVDHKVKKNKAEMTLQLRSTPDILQWLGEHKSDGQTLIGFAMETEELLENAEKKRQKKNADWIIANTLTEAGAGFDVDTNIVHLLGPRNQSHQLSGLKKELAGQLLDRIFASDPEG